MLGRKLGGRYVGTENLTTQAAALDRFQLPQKIRNGVVDPTTGRFKCICQTVDVADECIIPRGFDHSTGAGYLDWLEPLVKDNPLRGSGGAVQFTQEKQVIVTVIDLKSGQVVRDQAHLQQLLTAFP